MGDVVRIGSAVSYPPMAAGHDAGSAVLGLEVDERNHRGDLDVVVGPRKVRPHVFVAMGDLRLGTGTPDDEVPEVQPVARALWEQDGVADRQVRGVGHHLVREGGRHRRERRHVLGVRAEERLDGRVDRPHSGFGFGHRGVDFVVDRDDGLRTDQLVDEHGTVLAELVDDCRRVLPVRKSRNECAHRADLLAPRAEVRGREQLHVGVLTQSDPDDRSQLHERDGIGGHQRVLRVLFHEQDRRSCVA